MNRRPAADQLALPQHVRKAQCTHRTYSLSCEEFDELQWRAAGRCEVCREQAERLVLDHDHSQGNGWNYVRGMACVRCNNQLRYVDDGSTEPTPAQRRYLDNSWFLTHPPADRPSNRRTNVSIRLSDAMWDRLGVATSKVGVSRAQPIRQFMLWYLRRPGAVLPRRPGG